MLERFSNAAKAIKRNKKYKLWKDGFHLVELTDNKMIDQKLEYIHQNPVVEEIVINAEDYKYSSAADYADSNGLLKIELLV